MNVQSDRNRHQGDLMLMLMLSFGLAVDTQGAPPADFVEFATAAAVPIDGREPTGQLSGVVRRDTALLHAAQRCESSSNSKLQELGSTVRKSLGGCFESLNYIAEIDKLTPSGKKLLQDAMTSWVADEGTKEAKKFGSTLFEKAIGGLAAAAVRSEYRSARQGVERKCTEIWEAAQSFAGPVQYHKSRRFGIAFKADADEVQLTYVWPNTPANKAGLLVGDVLTHAENRPLSGLSGNEVLSALACKDGGTMQFKVRKKDGRIADITLTRTARIPMDPLSMNYNCSWHGAFVNDLLVLGNEYTERLTNCTLIVKRTSNARSLITMHFLSAWDSGQTVELYYRDEQSYERDARVFAANTVTVWLYADQLSYSETLDYAHVDRESDIRRYWDKLTFKGGWRTAKSGFFFDTDAGMDVSFVGIQELPVEAITVTATQGKAVKAYRWTIGTDWNSGHSWLNKRKFRGSEFNGMNPDRVEIKFELTDSTYQPSIKWTW